MKSRVLTLVLAICLGLGISEAKGEPRIIPVQASTNDSTETAYRLIVKEIPGSLVSDTIYGQKGNGQTVTFGGAGDKLLNKIKEANPELVPYIEQGVLTLERHPEKGIILSGQKDKIPENLIIKLYGTYNAGKNGGWCPDANIVYEINWEIHKGKATEKVDNPADPPKKAGDEEELDKTPQVSKWSVSYIDLILLLLILILLGYISSLASKIKKLSEASEKDEKREKMKRVLATLEEKSRNNEDSIAAIQNNSKGIFEVVDRLKGDLGVLNKKVDRIKTDVTQLLNTGRKSEQPGKSENKPQGVVKEICFAHPVNRENALIMTDGAEAFFEIKEYPDGKLMFSLRDVPELKEFFETSASMLDIYKNSGIINYSDVPANSHVKVKEAGIVTSEGNGKYQVVSPLELTFEI